MESFASGEIRILVSTTVVEVGVDVPNATVMLIENAERFGLAQLHQLRGRVGRGVHQSYCIFMAGQTSEAVMKRLSIMKESDDGFEIAEKDFELRGPGDLLGIRQSGDAMFRLADVSRDREMLKMAGETAGGILSEDPALLAEDHQSLREELNRYMSANERNITL
jgi:ATP-dependent DNA helicase RecG